MTIIEAVNKFSGEIVRIQTVRSGYTQFISTDEDTNKLLLGRIKNYEVERVETYEYNGRTINHIYSRNYLNYNF